MKGLSRLKRFRMLCLIAQLAAGVGCQGTTGSRPEPPPERTPHQGAITWESG